MDCPSDAALDVLYRRYNGPPPAGALRMVWLGGPARANALRHAAVTALHERLAAEARLGTARRRATLTWRDSGGDAWLARLTATLAHHRAAAVAISGTRIPSKAPAPA